MKPSFKDVFWIINRETFQPKLDYPWMDDETKKKIEWIDYYKVIPVYVKCIEQMYDGSTQFSITPVDVRDGVKKYWKWSR